MSKNLLVNVRKRTSNGVETWEGTANLPGVAPTKLVKAKTNETTFASESEVNKAARRLATRYGFDDVQYEVKKNTKTKVVSD